MNQRRNNGGGNRQRQNNQVEQQNDAPAVPTAGVVFAEIMRGVDSMAQTIIASLPTDVSFPKFRATLMMAMRHNPDIMHCSTSSIITGAMKAAIDGVLLDGKEAALVPSSNKVKDFQTGREYFRKDARYNIMVAGIRKSVLKGGKVRDLQSTVVYKNEHFDYERGLNPKLEHKPILDNDARGEPVGVYAIAFYADGGAPSFEVMNKAEVHRVRDSAQSGPVWKGPHETEMWRKTVVRRLRKALPGQETLVDMEMADDWKPLSAQFQPEGGTDGVLPAKTQDGAAPRRADFAQLEHSGGEAGVPLDFGSSGEMTAEEVAREEQREQQQDAPREQQRQAAAPAAEQEPQVEQQQDREPRTIGPVPEGFETWAAWGDGVVSRMKVAATLTKLDAVVDDTKALFEQAPDDVRARLAEVYEDKATDHREAMR